MQPRVVIRRASRRLRPSVTRTLGAAARRHSTCAQEAGFAPFGAESWLRSYRDIARSLAVGVGLLPRIVVRCAFRTSDAQGRSERKVTARRHSARGQRVASAYRQIGGRLPRIVIRCAPQEVGSMLSLGGPPVLVRLPHVVIRRAPQGVASVPPTPGPLRRHAGLLGVFRCILPVAACLRAAGPCCGLPHPWALAPVRRLVP